MPSSRYLSWNVGAVVCSAGVLLTACVQSSGSSEPDQPSAAGATSEDVPRVSVELDLVQRVVPAHAYGMHTSVYDNALHAPELPEQLAQSGISLLRYPGGGYSDNYHWSTHTMTPWANGSRGWLANRSDFGSFVSVLEATGTAAMITVNYGSNLTHDGPGEPKEAAAWVAYANGDPDDTSEIGVDSTGRDWNRVGDWATLRAEAPREPDDGYNFLRIEHPEPLGIRYWEIGNEVFGNGYYSGTEGYELDLHVPYAEDNTVRQGHPLLSPTTYGQGVVAYAEAMKAVDPSIEIGAVLNTPPMDYEWGPDWNEKVLAEAGQVADFVVVHYYPTGNDLSVPYAPSRHVPELFRELRLDFEEHAAERTEPLEVAVTELGPKDARDFMAIGLFALNAYLSFIEAGAFNLDWLELHNGSFLSERSSRLGPAFLGLSLAHRFAPPGAELLRVRSHEPRIVAFASRPSEERLSLLLVNGTDRAIRDVAVTLEGESIPDNARRTLFAREIDDPETDGVISESTGEQPLGPAFTVNLPAQSATLFEGTLAD